MFSGVDVHVVSCIICDDVRTEVGGKEIVIGVYTVGISFPFVPWVSTICVWLNVIWSGEGELDLRLRILNPLNRIVGEVTGHGRAIWQGHQSTLTFRGLNFTADMEGTYDLQWETQAGGWESLRKFPVVIPKS